MRYLLVIQTIPEYDERDDFCMPIGIAYVNGAMRAAGYDVEGFNMMFADKEPYQQLQEIIKEKKIDVLLCGGLTSEYQILKLVYETAKKANPDIILVGGGGGFTSEPVLFSRMTGVDYAVIGEGEITNCELCEVIEGRKTASEVKGIVYRTKEGEYVATELREPVGDVDSLPFPSYEGLNMEAYLERQEVEGWYNYYGYYHDNPRLMPMMLSRSCPYRCSFCFHPMGNKYRGRSLDNFFKELDMWILKYQINGIALVDECFSMNQEKVLEFCRRIKPYNLSWACQMRAETYTDTMIEAMKDAGCVGACFGIESMSDIVLENMQKYLKRETIEKALQTAYKYQVGCSGNLIFGAETENFATMRESLSWCQQHTDQYGTQPITNFGYIQTYPGSRYFQHACENGRIPDKETFIENGEWNLNITEMSDEDYQAIGEIARLKYSETANRGTVIKVEDQSEKYVTLTARCFRCGKETTYRNIKKKTVEKGRIRRLGCRHCNQLNEYVFKEEKYPVLKFASIPWMLQEERDAQAVAAYFENHGLHKIGIFGRNVFTLYLLKDLKAAGSKIEVSFISDKHRKKDALEFEVPVLGDNDPWPETDAIILTDVRHEHKYRMGLESKSGVPVISLETILEETGKFHGGEFS